MDMYYEVHGEGPPLVLLHGYLGTGYFQWKAYVAEFGKEYQLILPDLRGHRRPTTPPASSRIDRRPWTYSLSWMQWERQGVSRHRWSSGAHVLFHMATQQPDRVEATVYGGGATIGRRRLVHYLLRSAYDGLPGIAKELWESVRRLHGETSCGLW